MVVDSNGSTIGQRMNDALPANNNATEKERAFAKSIRKLGNFERIGLTGASHSLRDAFSGAVSEDPYYVSPAYYALTGRRGLWSFTPEEDSAVLFCLHPNVHDTVLIFPPFTPPSENERATATMQNFLEIMQTLKSGMKFQIGRVPENEAIKDALLAVKGFDAKVVPEQVLDWAYPVPTFDLNAMRARQGGNYAKLRQALNSIDKKFGTNTEESRLAIRDIDFNSPGDAFEIDRLADAWERIVMDKQSQPHRDEYDVADSDYFGHLVRMGRVPEFNLRGVFLVLDGEPQGFSIWEAPVGKSKTANVFASQVAVRGANDNTTTPHFTTGLVHQTGREIRNTGGKYMCLGGSETENQYRYKQKFVPQTTFPLVTISLTMEANKTMPLPVEQGAIEIPVEKQSTLQYGDHDVPYTLERQGGQQQQSAIAQSAIAATVRGHSWEPAR